MFFRRCKSGGDILISQSRQLMNYFFFFFQHERGEEKNCFLNPTIEQVVVIRRLYKSRKKNLLSFSLFSASSIIWMLQDCWGEVRKCQLMLRFLTIERQKTMFGRSLFASKLFFFFHGVGVGQGRVRAVFSSEQEKKMSNVRRKFLQCLC